MQQIYSHLNFDMEIILYILSEGSLNTQFT